MLLCRLIAVKAMNSTLLACTAGGNEFEYCKSIYNSTVYVLEFLPCSVDRATGIMVDLIVAFALLYFVITYVLLLVKLRGYRKQPYTFVQVGLVYNTLQVCQ